MDRGQGTSGQSGQWTKGQGTRDRQSGQGDKGQGTRDRDNWSVERTDTGTRDQGTRDRGMVNRDKGQVVSRENRKGKRDQGTRDRGQGTKYQQSVGQSGQGTRTSGPTCPSQMACAVFFRNVCTSSAVNVYNQRWSACNFRTNVHVASSCWEVKNLSLGTWPQILTFFTCALPLSTRVNDSVAHVQSARYRQLFIGAAEVFDCWLKRLKK